MTEKEKQQMLEDIQTRAWIAERQGLVATAQSWRDYAQSFVNRPAEEIVGVRDKGEVPTP